MTFIYCLIDPRTDEIKYVGKSNDPYDRYNWHCKCAIKDRNYYKKYWIIQLISENLLPILQIIEECSDSIWVEREQYWIKHYKDLGCKLTNLTDGGEGLIGYIPTEETRKKMSEALSGENHPFYGKHHTKESKKKISESLSGENNPMFGNDRQLSEEHKRKLIANHADFNQENNPFYGKHHTKESKKKISESLSGENNPFFGKMHSEDTKKKISASQKIAWQLRKTK